MAWEKGQSGNPKGRPAGTRSRITEAFLRDLEQSWRENGEIALKAALEKDPGAYVRVVASLLPKEFIIERPLDGLSDDELAAAIADIRTRLAAVENPGDGTADQGKPQPAGGVSSIH